PTPDSSGADAAAPTMASASVNAGSAPAVSASSPTPSEPAALTPAERSRILAGVDDLKAIVRGRAAAITLESEAGCDVRMDRDARRIRAAETKVGDRIKQKTRFSGTAPDIGQTVTSIVGDCVLGCLFASGDSQEDKIGREMVTRSCKQAL